MTVYVHDTIESTWDGNCGSEGQPGDAVSISWNQDPSINIFTGSCGALGEDCLLRLGYESLQGEGAILLKFYTDNNCTDNEFIHAITLIPFNTAAFIADLCANSGPALSFNYLILPRATEVIDDTQTVTAINPNAGSSLNYCSVPLTSLGTPPTGPANFCLPCPVGFF